MSNKKKSFENILKITSITGIVAFIIFKFFNNYSVDSARSHYESKSYKEYSLFEEEGDSLALKINTAASPVNTKTIQNEDLRKIVSELLPKLIELDQACKKNFDESIPNNKIIDPEDEFFVEPSQLFNLASAMIEDLSKRNFILAKLNEFSKVLTKMDEIDTELYYSVMRGHLICKSQNFNIFLESLYEASKMKNWDKDEVVAGFDNLLELTKTSLETDYLPDNILFSLNIIKTAGQASDLGDDFFQEIDIIYSELAEFEDRFADMSEGKIKNPIKYYDEYISQLEQISDDTRYLIERKKEGRFKSTRPSQ